MPHVQMTYAVPTAWITASDFVRGQFTVTGQVLRLVGGAVPQMQDFLASMLKAPCVFGRSTASDAMGLANMTFHELSWCWKASLGELQS